MSVDPEANLLAVVLAKDAKNRARDGFKRRPLVHVLDLATGDELWKYEVGEVEMMPARWPEDSDKEVDYTLDNYYPPVFVAGTALSFLRRRDFIRRAHRQGTSAREVSRQRRRTRAY